MPAESIDTARIETAVIMQFLGRDGPMTVAALHRVMREPDTTPDMIDRSVVVLVEAGVILREGETRLRTSAALARLDWLGLIGV